MGTRVPIYQYYSKYLPLYSTKYNEHKELHAGLEQLEGEYFWVNHPFKIKLNKSQCF